MPANFVSCIEASLLAYTVLVVSSVKLFGRQSAATIIVTAKIQILGGSVGKQRPNLPGYDISCDSNLVYTERNVTISLLVSISY